MNARMKQKIKTNPPGRVRIMKALADLMVKKDFNSITTAEIANRAKVTEALIYKYFRDKKDLLYQVLNELFEQFNAMLDRELEKKQGSIEKIEVLVSTSLEHYVANRVLAKILFLEVRSSPKFFKSDAYESIKVYAAGLYDIIQTGVQTGELKSSVDPGILRKVILGAIEHACLGEIIFRKELEIQAVSDQIVQILFEGAKA